MASMNTLLAQRYNFEPAAGEIADKVLGSLVVCF